MELTEDTVRDTWNAFIERVDRIKAMGGISLWEVENRLKPKPEGWVLDTQTDYYVPRPLDKPIN
jgi:hypothetical protein